jgi:hypothetical protein
MYLGAVACQRDARGPNQAPTAAATAETNESEVKIRNPNDLEVRRLEELQRAIADIDAKYPEPVRPKHLVLLRVKQVLSGVF